VKTAATTGKTDAKTGATAASEHQRCQVAWRRELGPTWPVRVDGSTGAGWSVCDRQYASFSHINGCGTNCLRLVTYASAAAGGNGIR
jgi:hypothetical protein